MIKPVHEFILSDTNELMVDYKVSEKPEHLKGSIYEKIPFDENDLKLTKKKYYLGNKMN